MTVVPLISDAEAAELFNIADVKPSVYRGKYPLHIESIHGISEKYRERLGGFRSAVRLNNGQVWGIKPDASHCMPRLGDDWDSARYRSEHGSIFLYQSPKRRSAKPTHVRPDPNPPAPVVTLDGLPGSDAFDPDAYTRHPGFPWAAFGGRILLGHYATQAEARTFADVNSPVWRERFGTGVTVHRQSDTLDVPALAHDLDRVGLAVFTFDEGDTEPRPVTRVTTPCHITINGRPVCEHTACVAGMDDAERVREMSQPDQCEFNDAGYALDARDAWQTVKPGATVEIVNGPCPEIGGRRQEAVRFLEPPYVPAHRDCTLQPTGSYFAGAAEALEAALSWETAALDCLDYEIRFGRDSDGSEGWYVHVATSSASARTFLGFLTPRAEA